MAKNINDIIMEKMINDLFATDTSGSNDTTAAIDKMGLPEGIALSQLPPQIALSMLEKNMKNIKPQTYNQMYDDISKKNDNIKELDDLLQSQKTALDMLGFKPGVSEDERRNLIEWGFGENQANLVGNTSSTATGWQNAMNMARNIFGGGDEARRARSAKDTLEGVISMKTYNNLKGAGAISNFELDSARKAHSTLLNRSTTEQDAYDQVEKMYRINQHANFRRQRGIMVDDYGQEWMYDPNTGKPPYQVISSYDPDTETFSIHPNDTGKKVINIPNYLPEDEFMNIYKNNILPGEIFFYKGQFIEKGKK